MTMARWLLPMAQFLALLWLGFEVARHIGWPPWSGPLLAVWLDFAIRWILDRRQFRRLHALVQDDELQGRLRQACITARVPELQPAVIAGAGLPYWRLRNGRIHITRELGTLLSGDELAALVLYCSLSNWTAARRMRGLHRVAEIGLIALVAGLMMAVQLPAWFAGSLALVLVLVHFQEAPTWGRAQRSRAIIKEYLARGGDGEILGTALLKVSAAYVRARRGSRVAPLRQVTSMLVAAGGMTKERLSELTDSTGAHDAASPSSQGRAAWPPLKRALVVVAVVVAGWFLLTQLLSVWIVYRMMPQIQADLLEQFPERGPRAEARAWLKQNRNPSALATNRFGTTAVAQAFVEELYTAGAVQVMVAGVYDEPARVANEGGPYADSLVVTLPVDKATRRRLFAIAAAEARREGFPPYRDQGQSELTFWWD